MGNQCVIIEQFKFYMRHVRATPQSIKKADCLVIPFFSDKKPDVAFLSLDPGDKKYIATLAGPMKGEYECAQALLPYTLEKKIILMCLGLRTAWTQRKLVIASRKIAQACKSAKTLNVLISCVPLRVSSITLEKTCEILACNLEMGSYEFSQYKERQPHFIESIAYVYSGRSTCDAAVQKGAIIGQETHVVRNLANTPGGDMTPRHLAAEAKKQGKKYGVTVRSLGEKEMTDLKMGGILGVSRGSSEEAQLIIMEYWGAAKSKKPTVFVGKGITFDSGGLDLKPSSAMDEMHLDMSGGAAVIGAVCAIARMKLKVNVIGLIPAAENMPSGQSYRPGDVLVSMAGKTIQIANTDAEGRVILADALTYAERYSPSLVVDIATLTGAACIALGRFALGVCTPDEDLARAVCKIGEVSGDYAWPLPMWQEYEADIRGSVGDILNTVKSREAGATNGGMFLYQFAKKFPRWVHLDIAPTMTGSSDLALARGASGSGTRLLIEIVRSGL